MSTKFGFMKALQKAAQGATVTVRDDECTNITALPGFVETDECNGYIDLRPTAQLERVRVHLKASIIDGRRVNTLTTKE